MADEQITGEGIRDLRQVRSIDWSRLQPPPPTTRKGK